jgi:uncharacterized DUF497 family protein
VNFEWDPAKAASNRRKHGVSFEEAATAFDDPNGVLLFDVEHSDDEDRYLFLGMSDRMRLLVVCHVDRGVIRIISARKATAAESKDYGQGHP